MKLTSILLPVYNGEAYLAETLNSIFAQESEDFEVLVQDDASTDSTLEICRSLADPRLKYERNPQNLGCFGTINAAANRAQGDLLRLFSHDDSMLPGDLSGARAVLACNPECGAAISDYEKIDEAGKGIGSSLDHPELLRDVPDVIRGAEAARCLLRHGCISGTQSTLTVRTEVFCSVGGANSQMSFSGDYDLLAKLAVRHGLVYRRCVTSRIRFHSGQLSRHGKSPTNLMKRNRELHEIVHYLLRGLPPSEAVASRGLVARVHWCQMLNLCMKSAIRGRLAPLKEFVRTVGTRVASYTFCLWTASLPRRLLKR